jgi:uncharacterized protein with HEPN domain
LVEFEADRSLLDLIGLELDLRGEVRERSAEIPWRRIVGLRNRLVHAYFQADLALVWSVVEHDLPGLRKAVADLLDERT